MNTEEKDPMAGVQLQAVLHALRDQRDELLEAIEYALFVLEDGAAAMAERALREAIAKAKAQ